MVNFDINITVKRVGAMKRPGGKRLTLAVTVKLPVLTLPVSTPWSKFLKELPKSIKTSPTFLPMHTCKWRKTMSGKSGLPLIDEKCFAALKCQFKTTGNHSFFLSINSPQIAPNPGHLHVSVLEAPIPPMEADSGAEIEQGSTLHTPVRYFECIWCQ